MSTGNNILLQHSHTYFGDIYNFALYMTGSQKKAEKLTINVFSEAVKFKDYYVPVEERTWFLRNAINLYGKFYKVESGADEEKIIKQFESMEPYMDKLLLNEIFSSMKQNDFLRLFLIVPSGYRLPLVLKEIMNLNYEVISELLDIPVEIVKLRLNIARKCVYTEIRKKES